MALAFRLPAADTLPALTNAVQVLKLSHDEASQGHPVRLQGVITYYDPHWHFMFIQDVTAGIFVNRANADFAIQTGQMVTVEGNSGPGEFAPIVTSARLTLTGLAPLPVHATSNAIRSRQEKCHQDEDDNDDRQTDLHQGHEVAIGMFVSGIIIARCGRIFDLSVFGHSHLSKRQRVV